MYCNSNAYPILKLLCYDSHPVYCNWHPTVFISGICPVLMANTFHSVLGVSLNLGVALISFDNMLRALKDF